MSRRATSCRTLTRRIPFDDSSNVYVSGGREGLPGGTGVEVRGSLQDALRRRPGTARGATSPGDERHRPDVQHSAHHQSFTAHLRAGQVLGEYPSYSPLFAALSRLDRRFCRFIASASGEP